MFQTSPPVRTVILSQRVALIYPSRFAAVPEQDSHPNQKCSNIVVSRKKQNVSKYSVSEPSRSIVEDPGSITV